MGMIMQLKYVPSLLTLLAIVRLANCCDLEHFFDEKQVSVEESTATSQIVFRGLSTVKTTAATTRLDSKTQSVFATNFELINTYKGVEALDVVWDVVSNYRKVNVTFLTRPITDCVPAEDIPREYIIFCDLNGSDLRVVSIAKWDESTDQRVWAALGWSKWSDWSSCSVSCSAGIQQRIRHCQLSNGKCPGFNLEQRHCNLFGCDDTINPLAIQESKYYHPSKDKWQKVKNRPTAWSLKPNSYIWLPITELFNQNNNRGFPQEFALFVTLRLQNDSLGTLFSLRSRRRQDTYLSLELAGSDLKLIHASTNGTDVVRIPSTLNDKKWHQVAVNIRDDSVVESYVDCEWTGTNVLKRDSLDIPTDSDLIIGYLFSGDLEQMTISLNPSVVSLQCSSQRTPIIDPSVKENTSDNDDDGGDDDDDDETAKNTLNAKSHTSDSRWNSRYKLFKRTKKLKVQS